MKFKAVSLSLIFPELSKKLKKEVQQSGNYQIIWLMLLQFTLVPVKTQIPNSLVNWNLS